MDIDTDWTILEPGALALPTTKFIIRWTGTGSFIIEWNGSAIAAFGTLETAKNYVNIHMGELIAMGLEP